MPEFRILGNLEIRDGERLITPSAPKVRSLLALLVVRANQIVRPDSLIEELWGHNPPKSAMTTLQTYIYHLRRIFAEEGLIGGSEELLVTRHPGYLLRVRPGSLDSSTFEELADEGRSHAENGRPDLASAVLRRALSLWSGPALANVSMGSAVEAHAIGLEERRMHALQLRIQADMELGRHLEIVSELRSLASAHPLNEWFTGRLITAFACVGRRGEALDAYRRIRSVLQEELGLEPSPHLQELLRDVLAARLPRPGFPVHVAHAVPVLP